MDDLRAKALKEREELRERIAELDAFLAVYERLSRSEGEQTGGKSPAASLAARAVERHLTNKPDLIAQAAEQVIRERGKPMTRGELVTALQEKGISIIAADKARYLGTILWRKDQFINIEGEGYWLKGLPRPENPQRSVFE